MTHTHTTDRQSHTHKTLKKLQWQTGYKLYHPFIYTGWSVINIARQHNLIVIKYIFWLLSVIYVCLTTQSGWVGSRWRQRAVGVAYISSAADTQSRPVPSSSSLSTRCHVAHDGQRRHIFCSSNSFHFHFQVFYLIQLVWNLWSVHWRLTFHKYHE